jgi:cyclophilin family peptidyl-prolyl cis-trans isomerase
VVAGVHTLAAHATGRAALATRLSSLDLSTIHGPRWHAVLEALRGLRPAVESTPELVASLGALGPAIEATLAGAEPRDRKALVLARCELAVLRAIGSGDVAPVETCATAEAGISSTHGARLAVDAIVRAGPAMTRQAKADALLARAGDPRRDVAASAIAALTELDDPRVALVLRDALAGDDVGIVSAAAAAIGARAVDRQRRDPEAVSALVSAFTRLDNDHAVEARVAAIEALGNLARSAAVPVLPGSPPPTVAPEPAAEPPDWLERDVLPLATDPNAAVREAARHALGEHTDLVARFDASVPAAFAGSFSPAVHAALDAHPDVEAMRLDTSAGSFTIDLRGAPAPIARATLVKLAADGFFDGLGFHRVVPGFVVQGGDPRGDGYGGPGHVMPCEWSNVRFDRGVVGIALAGKDTGGSQIFVAHGRPVHLDARFSVVGRVTEGMDVVDAILPYDTIDRVELVRGDAP